MTDIGKGDWVEVLINFKNVYSIGDVRMVEGLVEQSSGWCCFCSYSGPAVTFKLSGAPTTHVLHGCAIRPLRKPPSHAEPSRANLKEPANADA